VNVNIFDLVEAQRARDDESRKPAGCDCGDEEETAEERLAKNPLYTSYCTSSQSDSGVSIQSNRPRIDTSSMDNNSIGSESGWTRDADWGDIDSTSSGVELEGSTFSDSTIRETVIPEALDVKIFKNRDQLMRYTRKEKKFYPKVAAKEMGPIRCLLKSLR
jgi:hypothetical protein